jgi:hypothetical protein
MNVRQYMERRCVCGQPRLAHVHFEVFAPTKKDGSLGIATGKFRVLPVNDFNHCPGFLDEIELELRGNPATNPLLAPLVAEQLRAAGLEEPP